MLTVLIATHGRPSLLARTLLSLVQCELPGIYRELIVVENGSSDGAQDVVAELPAKTKARYLHFEQGNKSAALNFALTQCNDDLVVFFDDDIRLDPYVLVRYAKGAAEHAKKSYFGGRVAIDYEVKPEEWLRQFLPPGVVGFDSPSTKSKHSPRFLGCNWAAYASEISAVGGFRTDLGPGTVSGGEEDDLQVRLSKNGAKGIFLSDAKVWHYVPAERCSQEWLLERRHKGGVTKGIKNGTKGLCFLGFPIRILLRYLSAKGRFLLTRFSRNQVKRFDAQLSLTQLSAYLSSARLQKRRK